MHPHSSPNNINHAAFVTYREKNPRMEAFIMTITPKSGRIDSYGLWRSVEHVTRWINEELDEECVRSFPTAGEEEGVFQSAFLLPHEKMAAFALLTPSIIRKIKSRHRRLCVELQHAVPITDDMSQYQCKDDEEASNLFANPS